MSLRIRLVTIVCLTLLVILLLYAVYSSYQERLLVERSESEQSELLADVIVTEIELRMESALTVVEVMVKDPGVQELFAAREREALYEYLWPLYQDLKRNYSLLHLHLPDTTSFIRFHQYDFYGDKLAGDRPLVYSANQLKVALTGIEDGRGGLGFRAIAPIVYQGVHQGTLELGNDLGSDFLLSLKEKHGHNFSLHSTNMQYEEIATTIEGSRIALPGALLDTNSPGRNLYYITDDQLNQLILIPLSNIEHNLVGYILVTVDRSAFLEILRARRNQTALFVGLTVFITALLMMMILKTTILKPLSEIDNLLYKAAKLDLSGKLMIKGKDEISRVAQKFNHTVEVINNAIEELKVAQTQNLTILDSIHALVYVVDVDNYEVLFINQYGRDLYGDVIGKICWQSLQKDQKEPCSFCNKELLLEMSQDDKANFTWERKSTFNERHYEYRANAVKWFDGRIVRLAIAIDSTERKIAEEIIIQSHEWYRTLAEDIPALICRFELNSKLTYVNDAYCRFIGKPRKDVLGSSFFAIIPPEDQAMIKESLADLTVESPIYVHESISIAYDGSHRWVKWKMRAIYSRDKKLEEYLCIGEDITEQKQQQAQLEYLSLHDPLTGLYNKSYHDSEIRRLEGGREYPVAIIVTDLDNLKQINDTYGHKAGDRVLKDCAVILKNSIRKGDVLSRVGGDEFVIVMPRTDQVAGEGVICRINAAIDSYNQGRKQPAIGISMGMAISECSEVNLEDIYNQADRIMYRNKTESGYRNGDHNRIF